jgi:DNA-binding beta-propeller fold protein YncE
MRTKFFNFLVVCTLLILNGCGGGGGGSSGSSSTYTASPSVFINSSTVGITLGYLRQMVFDGTYLYVSSSLDAAQSTSLGGAIYKFNTSGALISTVSSSIKWPFSVAVSGSSVFTVATDTAGAGSTGLINVTSSTTPVVTALSSPYGVGIDSTNSRVFITDVGSGTYADGVVIYNIGSYTSVLASVTVGSKPSGLAYDSSLGYMFVTRYSGGTAGVWKISTTSPYTPSAFATSSLFNNPIGIAVRSSYKEVYVANTGTTAGDTDSSILKITYDSSGNATAVTTFLSGTSTSSMLCAPVGLAINGNVLYISNGTCTTNSAYAKSVIKVTLDV